MFSRIFATASPAVPTSQAGGIDVNGVRHWRGKLIDVQRKLELGSRVITELHVSDRSGAILQARDAGLGGAGSG
jgi:hypothetical protein